MVHRNTRAVMNQYIPFFLSPFRTTLVGLEIFEVLIPRSLELNFFHSGAFWSLRCTSPNINEPTKGENTEQARASHRQTTRKLAKLAKKLKTKLRSSHASFIRIMSTVFFEETFWVIKCFNNRNNSWSLRKNKYKVRE